MKDIQFDIDNRDIVIQGTSALSDIHNVIWGKLLADDADNLMYMNIPIIYSGNADTFSPDGMTISVKATYNPSILPLLVRLVVKRGDSYISLCQSLAVTLKGNRGESGIFACQLPLINPEGLFIVKCYEGFCYIFSSDHYDVTLVESLNQENQLLTICAPGDMYRYPMTGIDAFRYINSIPSYTNLGTVIMNQLTSDNKTPVTAEFDETTAVLDLEVSDASTESDLDLADTDDLDTTAIKGDIQTFDDGDYSLYELTDGEIIGTSDSKYYITKN